MMRIYKTVSIGDAGKTRWLNEIRILSNTIHKSKFKWIKDQNVRPDTIELLKENIGRTLSDLNCNDIFFDPPPRVITIKINK